jgi:hypothetical protein
MPAPTHTYLTAHGSFASGAWLGEGAQFGLRLVTIQSDEAPALGDIFAPVANGDVALVSGSQAGTHGTLTKTFTFRQGPVGSVNNMDPDQQIAIAEDVWTFLDAVKSYCYNAFRWTHVKQSPVDSAGHAIGYSSTYTFSSPVTGTATGVLPPQAAMAVSLRAPVVGRRGRGRFYLPAMSQASLASDGTIVGTTATNVRAAAKTFIDNLNNTAGVPLYQPLVAIMSADSATAIRPTQVRTGNRFDTIRSRREQVPETYTATDLT